MPTGIGAASPKFSKSDRKPKKTRHCTYSLKATKLRIGNMIHQGQVWGNIFSDISRKENYEG